MFPAVIDPISTTLASNPLGFVAPGFGTGFDSAALLPLVFGAALWMVLLVMRARDGGGHEGASSHEAPRPGTLRGVRKAA